MNTPGASTDQYCQSDLHQRVGEVAQLPTPPDTLASSCASLPPTPNDGALAGRKRSREDIYTEDSTSHPDYTSGFVDTNGTSDVASFDPHSAGSSASARPIMPTRKSQRLDTSASGPSPAALGALDVTARSPGAEPLIDEATKLLGVSWTRMDSTESSLISQRAYTRWITRHYPALSNVEVWFENAAIPGYLGKATNSNNGAEEYYLWSYDLHQAILVTRNPGDLIFKLSQPHMSLSQATETITADVQPVVEASAANAAIVHNDRFVIDEPAAIAPAAAGMELD